MAVFGEINNTITQRIKLLPITAEAQRPQRIEHFSFAGKRPAKENLASSPSPFGRRPHGSWRIRLSPILHQSPSSLRPQRLERVHVFRGRVGGEMH